MLMTKMMKMIKDPRKSSVVNDRQRTPCRPRAITDCIIRSIVISKALAYRLSRSEMLERDKWSAGSGRNRRRIMRWSTIVARLISRLRFNCSPSCVDRLHDGAKTDWNGRTSSLVTQHNSQFDRQLCPCLTISSILLYYPKGRLLLQVLWQSRRNRK